MTRARLYDVAAGPPLFASRSRSARSRTRGRDVACAFRRALRGSTPSARSSFQPAGARPASSASRYSASSVREDCAAARSLAPADSGRRASPRCGRSRCPRGRPSCARTSSAWRSGRSRRRSSSSRFGELARERARISLADDAAARTISAASGKTRIERRGVYEYELARQPPRRLDQTAACASPLQRFVQRDRVPAGVVTERVRFVLGTVAHVHREVHLDLGAFVGQHAQPAIALIRLDLPRLKAPKTATRQRSGRKPCS